MSAELRQMPHRVVVVDDTPSIHDDFRRILSAVDGDDDLLASAARVFGRPLTRGATRPRFEISSAFQGRSAVEMVRAALTSGRPYCVAFVDMLMPPGWDGLKTIQEIWAVDPELQIVICSAHSDYDWVELLETLGFSDQLIVLKKPVEPIEILQCAGALAHKWQNTKALKRHVEDLEYGIAERTQTLEAANRQLRYLASHDALTGLPNRTVLEDRLQQAIAHAQRTGDEFAVLMVDLDRFKIVNDSLGHRAGDELLKEVARRLKESIRADETLARIGGDEFVIVLSAPVDLTAVNQVAARVVAALAAPMQVRGVEVHTSPSIGIAFYPKDGAVLETLLVHADAAMYAAKASGRNGAQHYVAGMEETTHKKMKIEAELRQALANGEFELHYQPKVDLQTSDVHGAEALIRWRHPSRGLLRPDEFIPVAEECGLIGAIGRWVLTEACAQVKQWQREGIHAARVAVNLAPAQFRLTNLATEIRDALDRTELEPRFLEIELTESAVMSDAEKSVEILEHISRMGVLVSIDDFGTGYSSMSYLRRFPVDKLKIDREFINELTTRPEDASIVRAVISLAHSLKLKVVAEGVETAEQLSVLKALGCDQYQGYYFSAALPAAAFSELMRKQPTLELDEANRTHSKLEGIPAPGGKTAMKPRS